MTSGEKTVEEKTVRQRIKEKVAKFLQPPEIRKEPQFKLPVIFGFGSGGCNILAGVKIPEELPILRVAVNSSERDLINVGRYVDYTILAGGPNGSGMNPERGGDDINAVLDRIPRVVSIVCEEAGYAEPDVLVTISTFGHGFGTGSTMPVLDKLYSEFPKAVLMPFIICPFLMEGRGKMDIAAEELRHITERYTTFPISNETVAEKIAPNRTKLLALELPKIYARINEAITQVLITLASALAASEAADVRIISAFDRSDMSIVFQGQVGILTHASFHSIGQIDLKSVKEAERREWLQAIKRKKDNLSLSGTYIMDGVGAPKLVQGYEINKHLFEEYNIDTGKLKPLIVSREKEADFLLIKSGYAYGYEGANIYAEY